MIDYLQARPYDTHYQEIFHRVFCGLSFHLSYSLSPSVNSYNLVLDRLWPRHRLLETVPLLQPIRIALQVRVPILPRIFRESHLLIFPLPVSLTPNQPTISPSSTTQRERVFRYLHIPQHTPRRHVREPKAPVDDELALPDPAVQTLQPALDLAQLPAHPRLAARALGALLLEEQQHQRVAHAVGDDLDLFREERALGVVGRHHGRLRVFRLEPLEDEVRLVDGRGLLVWTGAAAAAVVVNEDG